LLRTESSFCTLLWQMHGVRYIVASKDNPQTNLVREFYNEVVLKEFTDAELEEVEQWIRIILDGGASARYILNIGLLINEEDGKVVGGSVQELYRESKCGLVAYIAIHSCMRGKGCAKYVMQESFKNLKQLCRTTFECEMNAMFIEVAQARDADGDHDEGRFCAKQRQEIWKRLDFRPLDFDLVHVGRMKSHQYLLGLWSEKYDHKSRDNFPTSVLLSFLDDFATGVLEEESSDDRDEIEQYYTQLQGTATVGMGHEYWR